MPDIIDQPIPDLPHPPIGDEVSIVSDVERKARYRAKLKMAAVNRKMRLKQFILDKRRYFRALDVLPREKRVQDTDLMCRYYNADQYGAYDDLGIYRDDRQDGDMAYTLPVISGHVDQALLQIFKVKPQYIVNNDDKDDATMKMVAGMSEDLALKDLERLLGPKAETELLNILLSGESETILGWEPNKTSPKIAKRPKYREDTVDVPAHGQCQDCGTVAAEDAKSCVSCQSINIAVVPAGSKKVATFLGYDEIPLGENTLHVPHMMSIQRDMSALEPEDSTFMIEYSYMPKHVAEWEYQSEIEPSDLPMPIEMQLRYDLERSTDQTDSLIGSGRLAAPSRDTATGAIQRNGIPAHLQPQERHFWEPSEYGQFYCTEDEMLPDGTIMPAGTQWGDLMPNGAFLLIVGNSIMRIRPCVRRKKVTIIRYGRTAGTNSGAGLKKLMPLQDAVNDSYNLTQTVKFTVGHPLTVINGHYINELPSAGNVLKITKPGLDDINRVVAQFPGQIMNNGDGIEQTIQGALQFIAGTNTVGGMGQVGAPDMKAAGTATGIAAMQEQAAGRQSITVDQRIKRDMELMFQILENIQEYSTDEQKAELAKRYGEDVVKRFFETNLRQSLTISIKSNSDMPRSMALTQANYLAFSSAAAQIIPMAGQAPWVMELLSSIADSMGFPFTVGEGRDDRREAVYRLNLIPVIEQDLLAKTPALMQDPMQLANDVYQQLAAKCNPLIDDGSHLEQPGPDGQPPDPTAPDDKGIPRIFMQVHESFMDAYKDAIFGERAKGWSQAHRLVVLQLWLDHYKASMQKKAIEVKAQAAAEQSMNPQPPQAPQAPPKRISESMSYKDAPDDIKRQMEAAEGYQPSQSSEGDAPDNQAEAEMQQSQAQHGQALEQSQLQHAQNMQAQGAQATNEQIAAEADHRRQLERQAIEQEHAKELEKIRQANKPKGDKK